MIFDTLDHHALYASLGQNLAAGLQFLLDHDLNALPVGRVEIDGSRLFALVQEYQTKPPAQGVWEAHRQYIDIQYLVSGRERMGFANLHSMTLGDYLPERDFQAMTGAGNSLELFANAFTVFFPQDGHMPGLWIDAPEKVRKVVVKVKIE